MPVAVRLCALLPLLSLFALGGCNLVVSDKPMFFAADAAGAPALRQGLWAAPDKDCAFDETKPVGQWPKCAHPSVVGDNLVRSIEPEGSARENLITASPEGSPYVLAAGDPRVLQAAMTFNDDKGKPQTIYVFMAVQPVAHDAQGRITGVTGWFIQCGPPPPNPPKNSMKAGDFVTRHPLPGLTVKDGNCWPRDKAAIRAAAGPSRAWDTGETQPNHWVRDGER